MSRPIRSLVIDAEQRKELTRLIQRPKATQREVRRAAIILGRADGLSQEQTAERVAVNRPVVAKWEKRFRDEGIRGLSEARRPGRTSKPQKQPIGAVLLSSLRGMLCSLHRLGRCRQRVRHDLSDRCCPDYVIRREALTAGLVATLYLALGVAASFSDESARGTAFFGSLTLFIIITGILLTRRSPRAVLFTVFSCAFL